MKPDKTSLRYATLLRALTTVGMVLLLLSFLLYISGVIPSKTPPRRVTELWHLDAASYLEETSSPVGWGWISSILTGEGLAVASLVYLALCTIICMVALVPGYIRDRDYRYLAIVLTEAVVLALASTGLLV